MDYLDFSSNKDSVVQQRIRLTAYYMLAHRYRRPNTSATVVAETQPVYRTYKDRVFRLLFQDRKRLLELYNALNDTEYEDENALIINTLENAIFMKMRNDISFLIDLDMNLYEHQSSYCPNMPLRGLLYFADLYKKYIGDAELSGRKLVKIPAPHFIVFYNGTERQEEEFSQKLSDAYEGKQQGCIELTVRTININYGKNKILMEKCKPLAEYAAFIAHIRENSKAMSLENAVRTAIDTCIDKNILKEFLTEQKAEVIAMSIYEYDEEKAKKYYFSEGYEDGYDEGKSAGKSAGLLENVASIMKNLNVGLSKACDLLGVSVEDYHLAEQNISRQII